MKFETMKNWVERKTWLILRGIYALPVHNNSDFSLEQIKHNHSRKHVLHKYYNVQVMTKLICLEQRCFNFTKNALPHNLPTKAHNKMVNKIITLQIRSCNKSSRVSSSPIIIHILKW